MKKYLCAIIISTIFGVSYGAANSTNMKITSISTRDNGAHNIFFSGIVPSQPGCTHNDRAIIVDTAVGGSGAALLSVAMLAFATQKDVVVRVDGCTELDPSGNLSTSPKAIKMRIYN